MPLMDQAVSQAEFAAMIGVSEARVSQLLSEGFIPRGGTAAEWLIAYCERLRDQAAGRMGSDVGGLDLVQERAALARSQREAQDIKNAVARGDFAPIGLLADVLAAAAAGVVDRFEQLDSALKKACPDLPEQARTVLQQVIASARNEWIRATASLVVAHLDATTIDDDAEGEDFTLPDLSGQAGEGDDA
jgi:phage terminase Nu1 subunit (DNA packaging protein)